MTCCGDWHAASLFITIYSGAKTRLTHYLYIWLIDNAEMVFVTETFISQDYVDVCMTRSTGVKIIRYNTNKLICRLSTRREGRKCFI